MQHTLPREPFDAQQLLARLDRDLRELVLQIAADHQPDHLVDRRRRDRHRGDVRAVAQDRRAVADRLHLVEAMRHVDDGHAAALEAIDRLEEPLDLVRGQRRGRLVHDDQPRVERERLRDLHHLLLRDAEMLHLRIWLDPQVE